jgi:hypothetical protein
LSPLDQPVHVVARAGLDHQLARFLPRPGQLVVGLDHDRNHALFRHAEALEHIDDLPGCGFEPSIFFSDIANPPAS